GSFLRDNLEIIGKIAGAIIVVLGLHMVGIIKIPFLLYQKSIAAQSKTIGVWRSLFAGMLFAFGWTPCIGPILAGILAIAAVQESAVRGVTLLGIYSLGLGIPFILSAVFLNAFFTMFSKVKRHLHKVEIAGGVVLITIGVLIFTGKLAMVSQKLDFMNPEYLLQQESTHSLDRTSSSIDNKNNTISQEDTSEINHPKQRTTSYGKYDFTLKTLNGNTIRLSDYAGKVVLVNIWAPWCGPCRMEAPGFVKLYSQYKNKGFEIVSVGVETNEQDVQLFVEKYGIRWQVGVDDRISNAYGTYGLPDNFLFGSDGGLIKHFVGMTSEESLRPLIEAAIK
ncbi:MAG: redoxin domain-containing protein, partial [Bacteroidetes bacterium]